MSQHSSDLSPASLKMRPLMRGFVRAAFRVVPVSRVSRMMPFGRCGSSLLSKRLRVGAGRLLRPRVCGGWAAARWRSEGARGGARQLLEAKWLRMLMMAMTMAMMVIVMMQCSLSQGAAWQLQRRRERRILEATLGRAALAASSLPEESIGATPEGGAND